MEAVLNAYKETSIQIISEAIKSAVFIDENALPPYNQRSKEEIKEEGLSIDLYNRFKEKEVSLSVHHFKKDDLTNESTKNYLFNGRDLVLLDWRLDGNSGEEYALELLRDIVVDKPHIHFCCLYTTETDLDGVFHNVLSYFSGETKEYYEQLALELSGEEEEVNNILSTIRNISVNRHNSSSGEALMRLFKEHGALISKIKEVVSNANDTKCALIKAGIAFDTTIKSDKKLPCPEVVSFDQKVLVIESTIVVILDKKYESDPADLIDRIARHVVDSNKSYTQLLGLEMQNIFDKSGSFIDANLLEVSKDALLKHREQLKKEGLKLPFKHFIKEVLFVQANLNVAVENLRLLDDDLLDGLFDPNAKVDQAELMSMNVFYNSIQLPTEQRIDFGWVFKRIDKEEYFICITPRSDCLRPKEKIRNSFLFAKGVPVDKKRALKLGDMGVISFLSKDKAVNWTETNLGEDDLVKYRPIYAKPVSYTVPQPGYGDEGKIELIRLDDEGNPEKFEATYVTTIKPNYAQRIANHAFNHPARVSVNFVKESTEVVADVAKDIKDAPKSSMGGG